MLCIDSEHRKDTPTAWRMQLDKRSSRPQLGAAGLVCAGRRGEALRSRAASCASGACQRPSRASRTTLSAPTGPSRWRAWLSEARRRPTSTCTRPRSVRARAWRSACVLLRWDSEPVGGVAAGGEGEVSALASSHGARRARELGAAPTLNVSRLRVKAAVVSTAHKRRGGTHRHTKSVVVERERKRETW
eukprot:490097-Rhodomonas_salina.6